MVVEVDDLDVNIGDNWTCMLDYLL